MYSLLDGQGGTYVDDNHLLKIYRLEASSYLRRILCELISEVLQTYQVTKPRRWRLSYQHKGAFDGCRIPVTQRQIRYKLQVGDLKETSLAYTCFV